MLLNQLNLTLKFYGSGNIFLLKFTSLRNLHPTLRGLVRDKNPHAHSL